MGLGEKVTEVEEGGKERRIREGWDGKGRQEGRRELQKGLRDSGSQTVSTEPCQGCLKGRTSVRCPH